MIFSARLCDWGRWIKILGSVAVLWVVIAYSRAAYHNQYSLQTSSRQDVSSVLASVTSHKLPLSAVTQPSYADTICSQHGWGRFKPGDLGSGTRRKVYDLIMINTELDWLEIRLNSTYDYVDYFVVVESAKTFTGLSKQLIIKDNWKKFAPYHNKLIYHQLEYPEGWNPARIWDAEDLQRNAMFTQVFPTLLGDHVPNQGDAIVVADVDEIPRPETLVLLRACDFPKRLTLRSRFYYYSFQFLRHDMEWPHPQATYYNGPRGTIKPVNLRNGDGGIPGLRWFDMAHLPDAGWHCSSCFSTMAELLRKMESFSHQWMNHPSYRDRARIADRVRHGKDIWDREDQVFDPIEDNRDVPTCLLKQDDKFKYLVARDGESAGFTDYP